MSFNSDYRCLQAHCNYKQQCECWKTMDGQAPGPQTTTDIEWELVTTPSPYPVPRPNPPVNPPVYPNPPVNPYPNPPIYPYPPLIPPNPPMYPPMPPVYPMPPVDPPMPPVYPPMPPIDPMPPVNPMPPPYPNPSLPELTPELKGSIYSFESTEILPKFGQLRFGLSRSGQLRLSLTPIVRISIVSEPNLQKFLR